MLNIEGCVTHANGHFTAKRVLETEKAAKKALRDCRKLGVCSYYWCWRCRGYHLTKQRG